MAVGLGEAGSTRTRALSSSKDCSSYYFTDFIRKSGYVPLGMLHLKILPTGPWAPSVLQISHHPLLSHYPHKPPWTVNGSICRRLASTCRKIAQFCRTQFCRRGHTNRHKKMKKIIHAKESRGNYTYILTN